MRENKQTRHDLGREKFVEQVWKWKEQYVLHPQRCLVAGAPSLMPVACCSLPSQVWQQDLRPAASPGRLCGLVARAIHHGRREKQTLVFRRDLLPTIHVLWLACRCPTRP